MASSKNEVCQVQRLIGGSLVYSQKVAAAVKRNGLGCYGLVRVHEAVHVATGPNTLLTYLLLRMCTQRSGMCAAQ
jgi:hypothetical protein